MTLSAYNGVNLNHASDAILEALVKYKFRGLTCSIDGASQETYSIYRVKGDFDRVVSHIKKINAFKRQHGSSHPRLVWQYVAFGHNEHEIGKARTMAAELGMDFYLKLSWDDLYGATFSPVRDKSLIRSQTNQGVADRQEYREKYGKNFIASVCLQLWNSPQINYDGKLLGCCINHWGDYGNVFSEGLEACLNSAKMQATRSMLLGQAPASADSPCLNCQVYRDMKAHDAWVDPKDIRPNARGRLANWLASQWGGRTPGRPVAWLVSAIRKSAHRLGFGR